MASRLLHSLNVRSSIPVTEEGMVTDVKLLQRENASLLILVTCPGMSTWPTAPGYAYSVVLSLLYNMPFVELYTGLSEDTFMSVRLLQPANAPLSIFVMLSGMLTDARLLQP